MHSAYASSQTAFSVLCVEYKCIYPNACWANAFGERSVVVLVGRLFLFSGGETSVYANELYGPNKFSEQLCTVPRSLSAVAFLSCSCHRTRLYDFFARIAANNLQQAESNVSDRLALKSSTTTPIASSEIYSSRRMAWRGCMAACLCGSLVITRC